MVYLQIFTYLWLIFMVNVAKYTSPMDPMGTIYTIDLSQLVDQYSTYAFREHFGHTKSYPP